MPKGVKETFPDSSFDKLILATDTRAGRRGKSFKILLRAKVNIPF